MIKLLINFDEKKIKPVGGPAGYLWNLKKGMGNIDNSEISLSFLKQKRESIEDNQKLRSRVPERIRDYRRILKYISYLKKKNSIDENKFIYDVIHYHNTADMYFDRFFLQQYTGKVVLTSHTPCVSRKERLDRLNPVDYSRFKCFMDRLIKIDEYAFTRADYIIFPCEEAEEPYFHTWPEYATIRDISKYKYLPTGIVPCNALESRSEVRKKYTYQKMHL